MVAETDSYRLQIFINSEDILKVKKDQKVKISFLGQSDNYYKNITGKISNISEDVMIDSTSNKSFYSAEV